MRWRMLLGGSFAMVTACIQVAEASSRSTPPFSNPQSSVLGLILSLGVVLVLIVLSIRFLASRTHVQQRGSIHVVAARQLAPNRSVQVIEVGGRQLLIGVGEQITLLADLSEDEPQEGLHGVDDAAELSTEAFADILATTLQDVRRHHNSPAVRGGTV